VFPIRFPHHPQERYDITLCYQYKWRSGQPDQHFRTGKIAMVFP
jgi:hypothetical protein